jgi:hypothetical protein
MGTKMILGEKGMAGGSIAVYLELSSPKGFETESLTQKASG